MPSAGRSDFAAAVKDLCEKNNDISIHAIIVYKPNVAPHIGRDENKLYNYMIRLCLVDHMCSFDSVHLIPDKRSVKVESGKSLHDYLQIEFWFTKRAKTMLNTQPLESHHMLGIQFAAMLAPG